jgi:hypothetical protein
LLSPPGGFSLGLLSQDFLEEFSRQNLRHQPRAIAFGDFVHSLADADPVCPLYRLGAVAYDFKCAYSDHERMIVFEIVGV